MWAVNRGNRVTKLLAEVTPQEQPGWGAAGHQALARWSHHSGTWGAAAWWPGFHTVALLVSLPPSRYKGPGEPTRLATPKLSVLLSSCRRTETPVSIGLRDSVLVGEFPT